jgi:hypothetical protein
MVQAPARIHLDYAHALFDDFSRTSRYVDFTQDNFKTYSVEFTRLLLDAGAEVDVLAKMACEIAGHVFQNDRPAIRDWRKGLLTTYKHFPHETVLLLRQQIPLYPWIEWESNPEAGPDWWTAYNNVKHKRDEHYREGNLENAMVALSGLQSLLKIVFRDYGPLESTVFF